MAGQNQILKFAQDATNILGQVAYDGDTDRSVGVSGVARSALQNKFQRQMSTIAAGIAQFIADYNSASDDVTDILTPEQIEALFLDALSNAPLTTQPQFDNSQKSATTAFVQRALGNIRGSATYNTNTNLTASDVGKIILPLSGGLGFSLPLANTMPNGAKIIFSGNSHGCAVSRQGSDVIVSGTAGTVSTFSVLEYDISEVTVVNGEWTITGGNNQLSVSSQFSSSLLTSSGHQYLPGGYIEQWGLSAIIAQNTSLTVNLGFSFPNEILNIQATPYGINHNAATSSVAAEPNGTGQIILHNWGSIAFSDGVFYRVIGR